LDLAKNKESILKFKIDIIATQQEYIKTEDEIHLGVTSVPFLNEVIKNMSNMLKDMRSKERLSSGDVIDYLEGTVGGVSLRVTVAK
jgi:hypothetical protein